MATWNALYEVGEEVTYTEQGGQVATNLYGPPIERGRHTLGPQYPGTLYSIAGKSPVTKQGTLCGLKLYKRDEGSSIFELFSDPSSNPKKNPLYYAGSTGPFYRCDDDNEIPSNTLYYSGYEGYMAPGVLLEGPFYIAGTDKTVTKQGKRKKVETVPAVVNTETVTVLTV